MNSPSVAKPQLRSRVWQVAAVAGLLVLSALVAATFRWQQAITRDGRVVVRDFRSARIDLANGFVHLVAARDGGVFDRQTGEALLRQALTKIERVASSPEWTRGDDAGAEELRNAVARFREQALRPRERSDDDIGQDLELRSAYVQLEQLGARESLRLRMRIERRETRAAQVFQTMLAGMIALVVGIGVAQAAMTAAERRARRALKRRDDLQTLLLDLSRGALERGEPGPHFFAEFLARLGQLLHADYGLMFVAAEGGDEFVLHADVGLAADARAACARVHRAELVGTPAAGVRRPWERHNPRPALVQLLATREGAPWGAIVLGSGRADGFESAETESLEVAGRLLTLVHERAATLGELRAGEARYRLLAENVADVVWVLDVDSLALLYISPSVERQRGFTAAEVLAVSVFDGMAPEAVAAIRESFPRRVAAFVAGDSAAVTQTREVRQVRRDGTWIWVEMVTTLVREPGGALRLIGVSRNIDERKRMELQLRDSEARFRAVVESSPIAIFIQLGGRFAYVNAAALRLFGAATADDIIGGAVLDRFHEVDRPRVAERIRTLNERRETVPALEEHIVRPDGSVLDVDVAAVPFAVGPAAGALVFAWDITEQKRAREELQVQQTVLRETGAIAKVGGWSFDPGTGAGFWTDEVARIHDLEPGETTSVERGIGFYCGESQARIRAALTAAVAEARSYDLVLEMNTAKGAHKWVRTIGHPVLVDGKVVRVRGSFQDVTELYETVAALRESEARFRELAETINEVFWIIDPEQSRVLYVSPAYERVWGRPVAELHADPASWLAAVHEEDRPRVAAAVSAIIQGGVYNETFRVVRPDKEVRWVQDRAYPVRGPNGAVVRIVGVAEDVTEKKRIETQFLRAQRLEAVGALAGGVAHDLNNILTPVLMAAGVLRGEYVEERNLELLSMIEQSARRGADIIRQLLAFSRGVEGERIVLQPRHIVREMASIVRETFPRAIELRVLVDADLWPVEANSTQIHQVLMNLCVNARDAMPHGGRLTLEAHNRQIAADGRELVPELRPGPYVVLTVSDTGEGMDPATLARIFEPFFTTKEPGKGTGLGLSTVLGIVRSHGGHVAAYSEPGRGSQLRVYLPACPTADAPTPGVKPPAPPRGRAELVLVVDDEMVVREATRRVLEKGGYRVLVAANGEEALRTAAAQNGALSLVLTDIMMPLMDGIALARALHTLDPRLPVVATTGLETEQKQRELRAAGVRATIAKPCASSELLAVVGRVLGTAA